MTPTTVSSVISTPQQFSGGKSGESPHVVERGAVSQGAGSPVTKDGKETPVDTVSISFQPQQTVANTKKEESLKREAKREEVSKAASGESSDKTPAKVEFVYNLNGELRTRYLDSSNRLIYQTPSDLMLRMKEAAAKSDSAVDMKV